MIKYLGVVLGVVGICAGGYAVYQNLLLKKQIDHSVMNLSQSSSLSRQGLSSTVKQLQSQDNSLHGQVLKLAQLLKAHKAHAEDLEKQVLALKLESKSLAPDVGKFQDQIRVSLATAQVWLALQETKLGKSKSHIQAQLTQAKNNVKATSLWTHQLAVMFHDLSVKLQGESITSISVITSSLDRLNSQLSGLQFNMPPAAQALSKHVAASDQKNQNWKSELQKSWKHVRGLIVVRQDAKVGNALISNAQRLTLVQSAQYGLMQAHWAAVQGNVKEYTYDLKQVKHIVVQYFKKDAARSAFESMLNIAAGYHVAYSQSVSSALTQAKATLSELK